MKARELLKKDKKELEKLVQENRKKLSDLRFNFSSNKLKNTKEINNYKKDIARILTVQKELENKAKQ
jgi:large subunit ribosomal protein L29